jgi:oligopeptide transport system ATP-binding protein
MALLEVDDLRTYFSTPDGDVHAVDGVSFSVERGETLGIVGESGCGKSVTALSIMGLLPKPPARIVGGSVRFEDAELTRMHERELEDIRGLEIAMIFQDPMTSLNPTLTIGTQLTETLRRHLGMSKEQARRRAVELSCNPKLLIADEPTTALDVTVQAGVLDLLEELRDQHDMAMILITHDMGVIAEAADEVLVMYAGQVVEQAPVLELFDHPEHPYTEALLGALPDLEDAGARAGRLTAIPGRPPDLLAPPKACRFAARCPWASLGDYCSIEAPELRELRRGHWVRTAHPASERAGAEVALR